jgi:hypothetical protein
MTVRLRNRLGSESGFVVPALVGVLAIALILLSVAATAALRTTDTSHHDVWSRQALQAADAGVDLAARRSNSASLDLRQVLNLNLNAQCVASTDSLLGVVSLGADGWCPPVAESLGTGMSFSYRMSSLLDVRTQSGTCGPVLFLLCVIDHALSRQVVATGMAGPDCPNGTRCVKRRVLARLSSTNPTRTTAVAAIGGLNILGSLNLQLYTRQQGSYRECTVTPPTPSDPASGC